MVKQSILFILKERNDIIHELIQFERVEFRVTPGPVGFGANGPSWARHQDILLHHSFYSVVRNGYR